MKKKVSRNIKHRHVKKLSQNFLQDTNIARKIVDSLEISDPSLVIEIGAGSGILTQFLVNKAQQVISIEIDTHLAENLAKQLGNPANLEIISCDFLKLDLKKIFLRFPDYHKIVIGNLPYHITSPIIFKVLDYAPSIEQAVFMVQKEVGQRLASRPGSKEYGILSVFCQLYSKVDYLFTVPAHLFFPAPKVESGVIRQIFKREAESCVENIELFRKIVRHTFNQRRKMLRNTLSILFSQIILSNVNIDLTRRPETLSVEEFTKLANQIHQALTRETL